MRPSDKVGHILHWEGILIGSIGVFLALLVFDFVLLDLNGSGAGIGYIAWILAKLCRSSGVLSILPKTARGWHANGGTARAIDV